MAKLIIKVPTIPFPGPWNLPVQITIDYITGCTYDKVTDSWTQPYQIWPGVYSVKVGYTLTNLQQPEGYGSLECVVGKSSIGQNDVYLTTKGTLKGEFVFPYWIKLSAGEYTVKITCSVGDRQIPNPAFGKAGPAVPPFITISKDVGWIEKTYNVIETLILATDYVNAALPPSPQWVLDGHTYLTNDPPVFEWMPVLMTQSDLDTFGTLAENEYCNNKLTGISGYASDVHLAPEDLPFTHPFANDNYSGGYAAANSTWGNDFNFDVDVDPAYEPIAFAGEKAGAVHVELDQGLFPLDYRPKEDDRVVVFGRWIIDAGHPDFGSEIHPPLFIASGRAINPRRTESTIIARPYLVSQAFGHDGQKPKSLTSAVNDQLFAVGLNLVDYDPYLTLSPTILPSWQGYSVNASYVVRPPTFQMEMLDELWVECWFIARTGVQIYVQNNGDNSVRVFVVIDGSKFVAAPTPPPGAHTSIVTFDQFPPDTAKTVKDYLYKKIDDNTPGNPVARDHMKTVVNNGARVTWYEALNAESQLEGQLVARLRVSELPSLGGDPVNAKSVATMVDDTQPFPFYGHVNVYWSSRKIIAPGLGGKLPDWAVASLSGKKVIGKLIANRKIKPQRPKGKTKSAD